jgi:hypothetical protein
LIFIFCLLAFCTVSCFCAMNQLVACMSQPTIWKPIYVEAAETFGGWKTFLTTTSDEKATLHYWFSAKITQRCTLGTSNLYRYFCWRKLQQKRIMKTIRKMFFFQLIDQLDYLNRKQHSQIIITIFVIKSTETNILKIASFHKS